MFMVHGKCLKAACIMLFLMILFVLLITQVGAMNLYCAGNTYTGKYDLSKPHEVNVHSDEETRNNNMKAWYQQMLAWGYTEEGAAAVLGNCARECGFGEADITQGGVDWEDFVYGGTGLGMCQWTFYARQDLLFDTAYDMGKQWTDLGVQLVVFDKEFNGSSTVEEFKTSHDLYALTVRFCDDYENPKNDDGSEYPRRYEYAQQYLDMCKGLKAKDYDGVFDTSSTSSSEGKADTSIGILSEWELTGMPVKSGLTANIGTLELGDRSSLNATDMVNIASIGDDISLTKTYNAWTTVRVIIVFVGLLMLIYALMLMLALFVDKFNNIFDFSMIGIITFGAIHFSDDKYSSNGEEDVVRTTDTKRMVILIIAIALIGGILVSGGVLPFILRAVYKVTSAITG